MKKILFSTLALTLVLIFAKQSNAAGGQDHLPRTEKYSQKILLKNWALSNCLTLAAKDPSSKSDADATANAYFEFGNQPIEAYEEIGNLVKKFLGFRYSGVANSEFNTMKCIDLFHSKELNDLTKKLLNQHRQKSVGS